MSWKMALFNRGSVPEHEAAGLIHFGSDFMADFGETVRYGDMVF